jgi:hypothetical protein
MAAIALANIAAATAAGYTLERFTLPSGAFVTRLAKKATGIQGQSGAFVQWQGESSVSSAAADTAALTNCNRWRDNRYGPDSASASVSPTPDSATSPSTQGVVPTHRSMTKDRD